MDGSTAANWMASVISSCPTMAAKGKDKDMKIPIQRAKQSHFSF
jgi:hypothetical protein